MPEIAFVMGKSASGKDTIYKRLIEDESLKLGTVTMYTTRPMRDGEVEGREYHFVSDSEAERMEEAGKIIELRAYNTVYGVWKYFTADDGQIDISSQGGGKKYVVIGTLEAYEGFCKYYGKEHLLPIYIEVDDGVRLQRALLREMSQKNPKYDEMCRRFLADSKDFSEENIEKAGISQRFSNNGDIDECLSQVVASIKAQLV